MTNATCSLISTLTGSKLPVNFDLHLLINSGKVVTPGTGDSSPNKITALTNEFSLAT